MSTIILTAATPDGSVTFRAIIVIRLLLSSRIPWGALPNEPLHTTGAILFLSL